MAVERIKEFTIDLGDIMKLRIDNFVNIRQRILLKREAKFQRTIMDEALSYKEQLSYRQKQIEEEQKVKYPEIDFIDELKSDVSYLKKMIWYEDVRNKYLENYTQYKEGKLAIDSLVNALDRQLAVITDPTLRAELLGNLSKIRIEKAQSDTNILNNRVILAGKDKSIALIDKVMGEINTRRNEALAVGDDEAVSALDVKIATLKSQKEGIIVNEGIRDVELKVMREGLTASQKLLLLDDVISKADKVSVIMVGNDRWESAFAYWTGQKDAYISGAGSGEFQDFFTEFSEEITNNVNRVSALSQFGSIPLATISSIDSSYKTLAGRTDFAPYVDKLENYRVGSLAFAIDKTADAIIGEASILGEWNKGVEALKKIAGKFGLDADAYIADLWLKQLTFEPATAEAAMKLAEFRAEQKGTTPEEELAKITKLPIEPTVIEKIVKPTVPTGEEEKSVMDKILGEVRARKTAYTTKPFNREQYIEQLAKQYPEYKQFIIDTAYRELRGLKEAPYKPPTYEVYKPPVPASVPAPAPAPAPAPKPTPEPEKSRLGKKIEGFPVAIGTKTAQQVMEEWRGKYIWDAPTKAWYEKP